MRYTAAMRLAALLLLALPASAGAREGDPEAGRERAEACGGCHGLFGNSMVPSWPALAGQQEAYLVKQLQDFRSGARSDPMMSAIAASLRDRDIEDLAAWYTQQAPIARGGPLDALGARIYQEGVRETGLPACRACHGVDALGSPGFGHGGFPALRGQLAMYTVKQLDSFASGTRTNDRGRMMLHIAGRMSPEEIAAVASYLRALPPLPATADAEGP